ncbi:Hypothetical protein CINCED_3A013627 [Cinara cedri]|uniref:Peptidase A1 domain-containing protein n=1 Tax=Cinara cedri TaxID=506608 RepID=A0A5E4M338_9HEMI|nr:Hypothetical protein CINCED_3A013627 [Cinara cedri]
MMIYYHRLMFFAGLCVSLCLIICTTVWAANDEKIYSMSLTRQQSQLEMLIKDPNYKNKLKQIEKRRPKNENVTLFKYLDTEYYAVVDVGKPAQKFKVIFDTTRGDMWIPSKLCSKIMYPICGKKNLYDASISSTHKTIDPPRPFDVAGLVGTLTCDTVRLAHLNVSDLIFAEVREIPNITDYDTMYADGVIGLGYNSLSKTTDEPFFYKLLAQKKIEKPIFSFFLNRDVTTNKGGSIFLGGVSKKHMKTDMVYVPVIEKSYWTIKLDQFSIHMNKTYSKTFCNPSCKVILDTSTNKIGVPPEQVVEINSLIGAVEYKYNRYAVSVNEIYVDENSDNVPPCLLND